MAITKCYDSYYLRSFCILRGPTSYGWCQAYRNTADSASDLGFCSVLVGNMNCIHDGVALAVFFARAADAALRVGSEVRGGLDGRLKLTFATTNTCI